MIQREVMKRLVNIPRGIWPVRSSSSNLNIEKLEKESGTTSVELEIIDEDLKLREEEIERKRNKSRLREQHRSIVLDKNPYPEPRFWHHGTLKYLRRAYGRYGQASGVNPSICWPIKEEMDDVREYERVKYPYTIVEVVADAKLKRQEKEEKILARQAEIVKKMEKLDDWTRDLHARIAKKENEAKAAKERKDRLIEEVKRHFGYTVDPRDERFKEMLEKKEKEQRKAMKEERRKAKEAKMVEKLMKKKNMDAEGEEVAEESQKQ